LLLSRGVLQLTGVVRENLGSRDGANAGPEGRWRFLRRSKIAAYLGWLPPPSAHPERKSLGAPSPAAANSSDERSRQGTGRNHGEVPPPPCTTSRIASPKRKLCYFRNSPILMCSQDTCCATAEQVRLTNKRHQFVNSKQQTFEKATP
jgi:hypothetical protein